MKKTIALLLISLVSYGSWRVEAAILRVPGDYPTIQQAIDAAIDGDEIVVDAGTYNESIDLQGKAVHLRSVDGPRATSIDAAGLDTSVVRCMGSEAGTIIEGFTIIGGDAELPPCSHLVRGSPTAEVPSYDVPKV